MHATISVGNDGKTLGRENTAHLGEQGIVQAEASRKRTLQESDDASMGEAAKMWAKMLVPVLQG